MKLPMRLFLSVLLLAGSVAAQELPAAPSATSKSVPTTAPAPQPQQSSQPAAQSTASTAPAPAAAPQPTAVSQPPKQSAAPAETKKDEDLPDTGTIIKKRVDEVNVIFTVTDKGGKFIRGLKQ